MDVNGEKGPNTPGRDIFYFFIDDKGYLVPFGSMQAAKLWGFEYWRDNPSGCNPDLSDYWDCAARIIENGWVMDY